MKKYSFDAIVFDLDGVITKTATVHSRAWKKMFDEYLKQREKEHGEEFKEFTQQGDYLPYVDGKPRYKGVQSFLESRDIEIPYGDPSDSPDQETVCGLGNRKNQAFREVIESEGVEVYESTVKLLDELKEQGLHIGVASSSKNCKIILENAGLEHYFETRIDGVVSAELGLSGKPEPDIFTTACDRMDVSYDRAVVVEDAVSGVQAGSKGNFGLTLGLAREDNIHELKVNGADIVVTDLSEIDGLDGIEQWFQEGLEFEKWSIKYNKYDQDRETTREALLAVGNGYFGTRGAHEETQANRINYPGTYIAGVYNRLESPVADRKIVNEDFVNITNWLPLKFKIEDAEWFDINATNIISYFKRLNFKNGLLSRDLIVEDSDGHKTKIESYRIASMDNPHMAAIKYKITPLNYEKKIIVQSGLDGKLINDGVERYKQLNQKHLAPLKQGGEGDTSYVLVRTVQSNIKIAEFAKLKVSYDQEDIKPEYEQMIEEGAAFTQFDINAEQDKTICIEKAVTIYTSKNDDSENPLEDAKKDIQDFESFDKLLENSAKQWEELWKEIDVEIEGDRFAQKLLRLHLYHLMVTASKHSAKNDFGIPARGLHGEAYRGHIFWDELYVLPLYNFHLPETGKSVLKYRYRRIDKAREYAKSHDYEGAMFPWQSGSDGTEETQVIHLNPRSGEWDPDYSSLQRHLNIAIAYNIWQYYWTTQDCDFIEHFGAEMFLDICRFWSSKTEYNEEIDRYEIKKVMGPDEFHEKYPDAKDGGVDNNAYTNIMVVWLFTKAQIILDLISEEAQKKIKEKIKLSDDELKRWKDITQKMKVPVNDKGIIEQFDGYFDLNELDWDAYREKYDDIHRMDRILKAEGKSPDAYKVAKQADTLMLFYNIDKEEVEKMVKDLGYSLPDDFLTRNFDYYVHRTSHGSTLSRVVHAFLANTIKRRNLSWNLYMEALASDYVDIQGGTTGEGIHCGVMGGTVLLAMRAFAGLNLYSEKLKLAPELPDQWRSIKFKLRFRRNAYEFEVKNKVVTAKCDSFDGEDVDFYIWDKKYTLKSGEKQSINIDR